MGSLARSEFVNDPLALRGKGSTTRSPVRNAQRERTHDSGRDLGLKNEGILLQSPTELRGAGQTLRANAPIITTWTDP
jgi:hypothetical protein